MAFILFLFTYDVLRYITYITSFHIVLPTSLTSHMLTFNLKNISESKYSAIDCVATEYAFQADYVKLPTIRNRLINAYAVDYLLQLKSLNVFCKFIHLTLNIQ